MLKTLFDWYMKSPSFWRLNIIGWCSFGVLTFMIRYSSHQDLERAIGFTLILEPVEMLFSGLLRQIYRWPSIGQFFQIKTAAWLIICSLVAATIQAAIAHAVILYTGWYNPVWTPLDEWLIRIIFMWLVYMGWSLGYFWFKIDSVAKSESQRADLAKSDAQRIELQLLRSQLDPHFLFNSLNGVAAEVKPHPDAALEMVRALSDYLRYSLDQRHAVAVPLGVELTAMRAYLRIEEARFGDELVVTINVSDEAQKQYVPSFLLQPLVENAMKHNLQVVPPWELVIRADFTNAVLRVEIANKGTLSESPAPRGGVGLETLRRRLILLYPERHQFTLKEEDGWVRARLELEGEPCSG